MRNLDIRWAVPLEVNDGLGFLFEVDDERQHGRLKTSELTAELLTIVAWGRHGLILL